MQINVPDLIAIFLDSFGILLCLAVGIQLLLRREGVKQTNLFLGLLLLLYGLTLCNQLFALTGIYSHYQFLYFIPIYFSWSIAPLYYLFVRSRVQPSFRFQRQYLFHFVLPIIQFGFYLTVGFRSQAYKSWLWRHVVAPYVQYIETFGLVVISTVYLLAAYQILQREIPKSHWKQPVYRWLQRFTAWLAILLVVGLVYEVADWILYGLYEYNLFNTPWLSFPLQLTHALISFLIGYQAFVYQHQALLLPTAPSVTEENAAAHLQPQVERLFREEQVHLDPELDLTSFAKMTGTSKNIVSKFFSDQQTTFRGAVNQHRVETFITLATQEAYSHLSLLGIAYEAGFNSKASFNRIFKELKGVSPSMYFKQQEALLMNK
ncbi:MAG: helix-turn-helix domain-containing protein [Thermonemataceae bacterium]